MIKLVFSRGMVFWNTNVIKNKGTFQFNYLEYVCTVDALSGWSRLSKVIQVGMTLFAAVCQER